MSAEPLLSAIVVAPEGWEPVRTTVRHLAAQSIADRIEVVFAVTRGVRFGPEPEALTAFAGHRVTEADFVGGATGYAAGVRAATAPFVVFTEDHCFPEPGWAEALLGAYDERTAAVGPVVAHANTDSGVAWADYLLGYGPWVEGTPGGEVEYLPGHNSSYRREAILPYEPDLESWLDAESVLHWDLAERGWRLVLEPNARTHHFSFSNPRSWLAATFLQARAFAGRRVEDTGLATRLFYLAVVPLIPLVRFTRCVRDSRRSVGHPGLLRVFPALAVSLGVGALGEAVGYGLGPGSAPRAVSRYEFRRDLHVTEPDRLALAEARFWE